ncbi:hypothetical protein LDENG_00087030 [Lucifuga dentata]|nr:hypothetical protein LDENG_00087030 [Lucifuga dentata]
MKRCGLKQSITRGYTPSSARTHPPNYEPYYYLFRTYSPSATLPAAAILHSSNRTTPPVEEGPPRANGIPRLAASSIPILYAEILYKWTHKVEHLLKRTSTSVQTIHCLHLQCRSHGCDWRREETRPCLIGQELRISVT